MLHFSNIIPWRETFSVFHLNTLRDLRFSIYVASSFLPQPRLPRPLLRKLVMVPIRPIIPTGIYPLYNEFVFHAKEKRKRKSRKIGREELQRSLRFNFATFARNFFCLPSQNPTGVECIQSM